MRPLRLLSPFVGLSDLRGEQIVGTHITIGYTSSVYTMHPLTFLFLWTNGVLFSFLSACTKRPDLQIVVNS